MLCPYREGDVKKLISSAVSTRRVSRNRAMNGVAFTDKTLLQGRIEPCHFPPIRPCGAAFWCFGLQPQGLWFPSAPRWRRGANRPHQPNPSYRAKTSRTPNSAAVVKPMLTPMMNRAMGAVWRVAVAHWKPPIPIRVMNQEGGVGAMARPMPILAMRQGAGGVGANRQGRLMLTQVMKRVVAAVVGGKSAQAILILVIRRGRGAGRRRRSSEPVFRRKRLKAQPVFRF